MPKPYLAFIFALLCVATSCGQTPTLDLTSISRPDPEPALPAEVDPFVPPQTSAPPSAGVPALAEWTRIGQPDGVIALTGSQLSSFSGTKAGQDTSFEVFGQDKGKAFTGTASVVCLDGMKAALVLPAGLPANSEYLVYPANAQGTGAPAAINATEAWWVGPNVATRGDTVSVYGRNLSHTQAPSSTSYVYILQSGRAGQWARVTAANPYKVDFTVPANLANGSYQVWVHNGRGGHYGWSGPLTLTVNNGQPWTTQMYNVKLYGAKGDGVTDDEAAIELAVRAAANTPWSTVYFPAGTYMVSRGFTPPSQVRWQGAGPAKTFLKASAGFVKPASGDDSRSYGLLFSNSGAANVAVENMTIDANGNLNGYLNTPVYMRFSSDVRFTNVTINAKGYNTADFHGSTRLSFTDCNIIGGGNGIFFGSATQVFMKGCNVYGTNDVNTMLTSWGGDSLSFENTTGQDYDDATSDGWAQGRFIYGSSQWGSNRNIYIGNCTTKGLEVRPGYADQNSGEQLLWENSTVYSGKPSSATATGVTFPAAPFFSDAGLAAGQYDAVIVNGTGLGQHRKIIACTGSTITVAPAWNVAPDNASTVIIAGVVARCAIYHNSLQGKSDYATRDTASVGIQPYGNSFDFVADSNTISQTRHGISLWGMNESGLKPQSVDCAFFNYIANNSVTKCVDGITGISQAWNGWPATDPYPGISNLANTCTGNTVSADDTGLAQASETAPVGDQIDLSVFDHNTVTSNPQGLATDSTVHVANTLQYKNTMKAGAAAGGQNRSTN